MNKNENKKYRGFIPSINCVNCQNKITKALEGLVEEIDVNISTKTITYLTNNDESVKQKLIEINYPIEVEGQKKDNTKLKVFLGISTSLYFIIKMILVHFLMLDIPIIRSNILDLIIATIVQIVIGKEYIISAINDLRYH